MDIARPQNTKVLGYLSREQCAVPAFAPRSDYKSGCHPDILDRLWYDLNSALPVDCRCLIYGTPALTHPKSAVILALGFGSLYGLRLPDCLAAEATKAGAKTSITSNGGVTWDIRDDLGDDWVFGAWLPNELIWFKAVYEMFDHPA
jgi:hypothetical protein